MVRLRLQRFGVRHNPFYRIVAADSRWPRDGKHLELLGDIFFRALLRLLFSIGVLFMGFVCAWAALRLELTDFMWTHGRHI